MNFVPQKLPCDIDTARRQFDEVIESFDKADYEFKILDALINYDDARNFVGLDSIKCHIDTLRMTLSHLGFTIATLKAEFNFHADEDGN